MENRPPNKEARRRARSPSKSSFGFISGVGVLGCWLLAATGCSFDDSALFSESVQGVECDTIADCPSNFACIDKRCVQIQYLNDLAGERFDVPNDLSEVLDPTGLKSCGVAGNVRFCLEGEICCNATCVAADNDPDNCGACGNVCSANMACEDGACVCGTELVECESNEICCETPEGLVCTNPETDRDNCGACGTKCATGEANESCLTGQCGCLKTVVNSGVEKDLIELCTDGFVCCQAEPGEPPRGCVDINTESDCGECGNKCGAGEVCRNGQCSCGGVLADGLGPVCGDGEACCFNPNGFQVCRPEADCQCGDAICTGVQICCNDATPEDQNNPQRNDTCVDPTTDTENCGGCQINTDASLGAAARTCQSGQRCFRNFDYSLGRPPEEQNAQGIFIGECRLTCATTRVQCPGGIDPETGAPYTDNDQSCIDPLSSREYCGAVVRRDDTSVVTNGNCDVTDPTTFGELRNFRGIECDSGKTCRPKIRCDNPDTGLMNNGDVCDPALYYYYDVSQSADGDGALLPLDAVFDQNATGYLENVYLRAVCDTICSNTTQVRCVTSAGEPICVNPVEGFAAFCGAAVGSDCSGDVDPVTGVPGPNGGDNNGVNCAELPNVASASCSNSQCTNLNCDAGWGNCDNDASNGCETDLETSLLHCGRCSTATVDAACEFGTRGVASAVCVAGKCNITCDPGRSNCQNSLSCTPAVAGCTEDVFVSGTGRDGCETAIDSDKLNCGACNNVCEDANNVTLANCVASACDIVTCATDKADCDGDPANGCEASSSQAELCNASNTCQGPSTAGTTTISGDRARPNNANEYIDCSIPTSFGGDPASSWACVRNASNTAYECQVSTCGVGFSACTTPSVCDPLNTTSNCTTCGNVCGTGAICTGSATTDDCKCTAAGETCRQTGTNYNSASCSGTNCVLNCSAGFADCDGLSTNGCETNINLDATNCGGCNALAPNPGIGLVCGAGASCNAGAGPGGRQCQCGASGELCTSAGATYAAASCDGNNCVLNCTGFLRDCNSTVADGCEVDISVPNETHCNGCSTDALGTPIAPPATGSANNCNNVPSTATSTNTTCINNLGLRCSYCGDNRYDGNLNSARNEACDDGNSVNGDGCSDICVVESGFTCTTVLGSPSSCTGANCGNGVVNGGEACDAATLPTATCDIDCSLRVCGDGIRNTATPEACDDGNTNNGDGCSSACVVEVGFTCTGPANGLSACTGAACGNGVVNAPEQCDSSGTNTAGCDSDCTFPACQDGISNTAAGEQCDAATLPTAACDIDCTNRVCGDGRFNAASAETCDDGNTANGDGCSSACLIESGFTCTGPANGLSACTGGACGNGVVNAGETCDAATLPTATCDVDCTTRVCGDGIRNTATPEACDDGNTINGDGCSSTCTLEVGTTPGFTCLTPANALTTCTGGICGNNTLNTGEACDDGNTLDTDGCVNPLPTGFCQIASCGDGRVRSVGSPTEQCDATTLPSATCDVDCTNRVCGDGQRNAAAGETCDDGNTNNGDGCSNACAIESGFTCTGPLNGLSACTGGACGNGVVNAGETCDAATLPTATCDVDCTTRVCGDGIRNTATPEACDDGNTINGDGCSSTCTLEVGTTPGFTCLTPANALTTCTGGICGNNTLNTGEACDDGNTLDTDGCVNPLPTGFCQIASCGDGRVRSVGSPTEQCDATTLPSATCDVDCTNRVCGDGQRNAAAGETCDDGNALSGDGCSSGCAIESGFTCTGPANGLSTCTGANCGNGVVNPGEACDAATLPTATCDVDCTARTCGDGIRSTAAPAEVCDDGNTINGDGCSSTCTLETGSPGFTCLTPANALTTCTGSICGNSVVNAPEQCDTGSATAGCDANCTFPVCGDNTLNAAAGEQCDDNNVVNGDGCSSTCKTETCGDGVIDTGEACDHNGGSADVFPPGLTCTSFGFTGGSLTCTTTPTVCRVSTASCTGICGNGVVNSGETCDDGNGTNGDGCSSCAVDANFTCTGSPSVCAANCRNGVINAGEQCDDNNANGTDGCSNTCTVNAGFTCTGSPSVCTANCGNGVVNGSEACDDGNGTNGDGCSSACAVEANFTCTGAPSVCAANCRNGVVNAGEQCDDNNANGTDGCSNTCTVNAGFTCTGSPSVCTANCRNGVINAGEQCDDNNATAGDGCSNTCTIDAGFTCTGSPSVCTANCRNGVINAGEQCDDNNATAGDGCSNTCTIDAGFTCTGSPSVCTANCRNGVINAGEQCDDNNANGTDGCSNTCTINAGFSCTGAPSVCTANCGNGIVNGSETCDDGNGSNGDGCSSACAVEANFTCTGAPSACTANCRNGVINAGEQCDDNNANGTDGCSNTCTINAGFSCTGAPSVCTANCGNGVVNGSEACDDNNGTNGDGCSSACAVEANFTCTGAPSVCAANCRNGVVNAGEQCDDNNANGTDGCSNTCTVNAGFTCVGSPSVCTANCRNGVINSGEACDDNNATNGDGCSNTCTLDAGFTCTGAPSVCTANCRNGVINAGEQCDDNNANGTDGCSNTCTVNAGFTCTGAPSVCTANCGNGIIDSGEACDPNGGGADVFPPGLDCRDFGYPDADALVCAATCDIVLTSCNSNGCNSDGTLTADEACDPQGGNIYPAWISGCVDFGYSSGSLDCSTGGAGTGCELDLSGCTP